MTISIPTKMDAMSYEILTNANFDYSKVTHEDFLVMLEFWLYRSARPLDPCKAWIQLLGQNTNFLNWFVRNCETDSVLQQMYEKKQELMNGLSLNWQEYIVYVEKNCALTNFDEVAAKAQHDNWRVW